jgi:hypothetical protein
MSVIELSAGARALRVGYSTARHRAVTAARASTALGGFIEAQ